MGYFAVKWEDRQEIGMSSLFSRCLALLLTVLFVSMIACAGDRSGTSIPSPIVDASVATGKSEQTAVVAGGLIH